MKLQSFQVWNFRSINDSGAVDVSRITSLIGRNESGKTNLLLAIESLNPPDGLAALNPVKDFPRDRRLEECTDDTSVVATRWDLSDGEQSELLKILPRAKGVKSVEIGRWYKAARWVSFIGLSSFIADGEQVKKDVVKISESIREATAKAEEPTKAQLLQLAETFTAEMTVGKDWRKWAASAIEAFARFRQVIESTKTQLSPEQEGYLTQFEAFLDSCAKDDERQKAARQWVVDRMPIFIYLDEYPALRGHQKIAEYLARKQHNQVRPEDRDFEKLCKVTA